MRLEWSYLRGRDDYMLRRDIQDARTKGCWMKGILMELRQSQAAGREGPGGVARLFGIGHLVLRSGGAAYAARCRMVVVELRNHTTCTQDTRDVPRQRCVRGASELGGSEISDSCEVPEKDPTSVEDRERMDLRIPRNSTM
jgi:hypothetical protein